MEMGESSITGEIYKGWIIHGIRQYGCVTVYQLSVRGAGWPVYRFQGGEKSSPKSAYLESTRTRVKSPELTLNENN